MNAKSFLGWLLALLAALATFFVANEEIALGVLATVLVSLASLYVQSTGKKIGKFWAQVILSVLAFVLGAIKVLLNAEIQLPPFDGSSIFAFLEWLKSVVVYLGPYFDGIVATAAVFYNLFWAKIQDYIGLRVLKLPAIK